MIYKKSQPLKWIKKAMPVAQYIHLLRKYVQLCCANKQVMCHITTENKQTKNNNHKRL